MAQTENAPELSRLRDAYSRRSEGIEEDRYAYSNLPVLLQTLEVDLRIAQLLRAGGYTNFKALRVLEVGCGSGGNLLRFLRWGIQPQNLYGIELLEDRYRIARSVLPPGVSLICGDAVDADCPPCDVVYQSTVFSSLLDQNFRERLAAKMWETLVPGGAVLWYDFQYNNPRNPDVRGVSSRQARQLFPAGKARGYRVTLAPPIGRRLSAHPVLYRLLSEIPWLRTHWIGLIQKPAFEQRQTSGRSQE
jgi:SAM-dependent methyltransferase